MSSHPDYFARIRGRVDVPRLGEALVFVFGAGAVGSRIAAGLARSGVASGSGLIVIVDGEDLDGPNVGRHALGARWVGHNKAVALSAQLAEDVPTVHAVGVPQFVEAAGDDEHGLGIILPDGLREAMRYASLVVAAIDDRRIQRGLGALLVDLEVPGILAGYDPDHDCGEVFVAYGLDAPCFLCADLHRDVDASVRAVAASRVDMDPLITLSVRLSLGLLDPESDYAGGDLERLGGSMRPLFLVGPPTFHPTELFSEGQVLRYEVHRRTGCPGCGRDERGDFDLARVRERAARRLEQKYRAVIRATRTVKYELRPPPLGPISTS